MSGGSNGKESACNAEDLGWEDPLEKEVATHSTIPAWRAPGHRVAESQTLLTLLTSTVPNSRTQKQLFPSGQRV